MNVWLSGVIIVAGLVMTARVYLSRHTLWQVLAGCANGFLCVYLMSMIN
nr:phosphatase PAP2 family protein [uncultured Duncaniella sp.]